MSALGSETLPGGTGAQAAVPSTSRVLLIPKNRGLIAQVERALSLRGEAATALSSAVRGEDIPYMSSRIAAEGRSVLAFTGDDLLDEWLAAGNRLDRRLKRSRIAWSDPDAIYGKPALCLIGRRNSQIGRGVRVAVCTRYQHLAARYLREIMRRGASIDIILIAGSLEHLLLQRIADFMIDIVVTGETIRAADLCVLDILATSDLAVLESV